MDLSTYQLRIFLEVGRRLNFTRAAEGLYLTQPAVSAQVRKLEQTAGGPLFEQLGKKVALTPAGEVLYRYAERILALEDELRSALADTHTVCEGPLAIGASTTIGVCILPSLLQRFLARNPRVTTQLYIGNVREVVQQVLSGHLDLALTAGEYQEERVESQPFMEDELLLVVAPGHRWVSRPSVDPAELSEEYLVLRERGSTTRALVDRELGGAGVELRVIAEMNNNEAIVAAVQVGLGVSLVSKYAVRSALESGRLQRVPLTGLDLRRSFHIVVQRRKHRTPAMRAFEDLLREPYLEQSVTG